ncbi:unnamed protein product [Rotaria sp. Silwood1]|nr:unnamed protein product [Rotaria sp. Silwood1]
MKTWQQLDDQRIDNLNQLQNIKLKLAAAEDLMRESQMKISNAEEQQQTQNLLLDNLKTTCQQLENDLTMKGDECEDLRACKEEYTRELQETERAQQQAEQLLTQLKQQERELTNQKAQAEREQQAALTQLNNAQYEARIAKERVEQAKKNLQKAEEDLNNCFSFKFLFISFGEDNKREKQDAVNRARHDLEQAEQKLETKKRNLSDHEQKHTAATNKTLDLTSQLKQKTQDRIQQDQTLTSKINNVAMCKSKVENITTQYRDATSERRKLQIEKKNTESKMEDARTKIVTLNSELEKHRQDFTKHEAQKKELSNETQMIDRTITNHQRTMTEHQDSITSNQRNLVKATNDLQQKQTIVELSKQKVQSLKQSIRDKKSFRKNVQANRWAASPSKVNKSG